MGNGAPVGVVTARTTDTPVVVVCNEKGGTGKTTLALGLAGYTASSHGAALLVDTDGQASAYDVTAGLDEPGYTALHELDAAALGKLRAMREYDLIVVDTAGTLAGRAPLDAVLGFADFAIVPYDHGPLSFAPTVRTARYVAAHGVPYGVLLANIDPRLGGGHVAEAWQDLAAEQVPCFKSVMRQYRVWSNSLRDGRPLYRYQGGNVTSARHDIAAITAELLLYIGRTGRRGQ